MDTETVLEDDISFLKEVLVKIESSNMHDKMEGAEMLRDQIRHMQKRTASQPVVEADGRTTGPPVECRCTPKKYCKDHSGGIPPTA